MKKANFDFESCVALTDEMVTNLIHLNKYKRFQWFVEVLTLKEGHSFGELALINNKPRSATITTISNCCFAILGRPEY